MAHETYSGEDLARHEVRHFICQCRSSYNASLKNVFHPPSAQAFAKLKTAVAGTSFEELYHTEEHRRSLGYDDVSHCFVWQAVTLIAIHDSGLHNAMLDLISAINNNHNQLISTMNAHHQEVISAIDDAFPGGH